MYLFTHTPDEQNLTAIYKDLCFLPLMVSFSQHVFISRKESFFGGKHEKAQDVRRERLQTSSQI